MQCNAPPKTKKMHLASIPKDIVMMNATIIIMNIMIVYIHSIPAVWYSRD